MNSNQIFDSIERIAKEASTTLKQELLKGFMADPYFVFVMKAALDPLVSYGIAKRPAKGGKGRDLFSNDTCMLLDQLRDRRVTGGNAIESVMLEMDRLAPESAELLWRIISKDLRAGFGATLVNKVAKGTIKVMPYMRCSLVKEVKLEKFDWKAGVYSQLKADGMFANVDVLDGEVRITARDGAQFPVGRDLVHVEDAARQFKNNTRTHGELLVYKLDGSVYPREESNGLMNKVAQGGGLDAGEHIGFVAWDQVDLSLAVPKGSDPTPYKERFTRLSMQVAALQGLPVIQIIETRIVHSLAEAYNHYREILGRKLEGTVIKDPRMPWEDKTSKWQVKLKLDVDVDLEITGFNPGTGKNIDTFGSVVCHTSDRLLEVSVPGFTDKERARIHALGKAVIGGIMTVKSNSIMLPKGEDGLYSLFLPRYVEIRTDKHAADSLPIVINQFNSAMSAV